MRHKLSKFFEKSSKLNIMLSLMALVLIVILMCSAAYSWIESISSIVIENKNADTDEVNIVSIENRLDTVGTVDTSKTASIDLSKYFRAAGEVHLSSASSANGEDIYFPTAYSTQSGGTTRYRKANINDKNVNYYDFSIRFMLNSGDTNKREFIFDTTDLRMNFGTAPGINEHIRCSVSLDNGAYKVFSKTASTSTVVSGTSSSTTSNESTQTFASTATSPIFKISDADYHTLNIKLWFQGSDDTNAVLAQPLVIENFAIKPQLPRWTVTAVAQHTENGTSYSSSTPASASATGGTVLVNGGTTGATSSGDFDDQATNVTLTATPATGYKFAGWYSAANGGGTRYSTTQQVTYPTIPKVNNKDYTYYALFKKEYTVTVKAAYCSTYNGTAYMEGNTGGQVSKTSTTSDLAASVDITVAAGESANIYAKAAAGYEFKGWDTALGGNFGKGTSTSGSTGAISSNTTIYGKFRILRYNLKVYACYSYDDGSTYNLGSDGGTVKIGSGTAGASATSQIQYNSTTSITASKNTNYTFMGWFTSTTATTASYSSATQSLTITGDKTLYAKFKYNKIRYFLKNTSGWDSQTAYAWDNSGTLLNGSWPGTAMTKVSGTARTYYVDLPTTTKGLIFSNNGSSQTADIFVNSNHYGKVYDNKEKSWADYTGPYRTIYIYAKSGSDNLPSWYFDDSCKPAIKSAGNTTTIFTYSSEDDGYYRFDTCPYDAYDIKTYRHNSISNYSELELGTPNDTQNAIALQGNNNNLTHGSWYVKPE